MRRVKCVAASLYYVSAVPDDAPIDISLRRQYRSALYRSYCPPTSCNLLLICAGEVDRAMTQRALWEE
jgi:hypothetical protein